MTPGMGMSEIGLNPTGFIDNHHLTRVAWVPLVGETVLLTHTAVDRDSAIDIGILKGDLYLVGMSFCLKLVLVEKPKIILVQTGSRGLGAAIHAE
jgi:hypothetical protein